MLFLKTEHFSKSNVIQAKNSPNIYLQISIKDDWYESIKPEGETLVPPGWGVHQYHEIK